MKGSKANVERGVYCAETPLRNCAGFVEMCVLLMKIL